MTMHRLRASLEVDRPIDEVFAFFSRPENLGRITPPAMGFELRSGDLAMREGLEVEYRVRPLLGIPTTWRSLIAEYDPPHSFRDVQLRGPYRRWDHRHTFFAEGERTRIVDEVTYAAPVGPARGAGASARGPAAARADLPVPRACRSAVFAQAGHTDAPMTVAVAGGSGFRRWWHRPAELPRPWPPRRHPLAPGRRRAWPAARRGRDAARRRDAASDGLESGVGGSGCARDRAGIQELADRGAPPRPDLHGGRRRRDRAPRRRRARGRCARGSSISPVPVRLPTPRATGSAPSGAPRRRFAARGSTGRSSARPGSTARATCRSTGSSGSRGGSCSFR